MNPIRRVTDVAWDAAGLLVLAAIGAFVARSEQVAISLFATAVIAAVISIVTDPGDAS